MARNQAESLKSAGLAETHPVATYFVLTFTISWLAAFAVAAPRLVRDEALPKVTGMLMFPAMLLGPTHTGLLLTKRFGSGADLLSGLGRWRVSPRWYAPLLIPPALILAVLFALKVFVSPRYAPNWFWFGLAFGVPAGFLEEIGWMGYAFPAMRRNLSAFWSRGDSSGVPTAHADSAFRSSVLLGLLWSLWHLPVINFLGTAVPHGSWWFEYFLAFAAAMTAMRVLICWIYTHTKSVLLCQLMHVSSTGSLVIFSARRVNAAQEAMWYAVYAAALWLVAAVVARRR